METVAMSPPVAGHPSDTSPLAQDALHTQQPSEGLEVLPGNSNAGEAERKTLGRTTSTSSTKVDQTAGAPSRGGTLKRNASLRKKTSLSRRSSKRSLRAGEIKGLGGDQTDDGYNNIFHTPVPTAGNPTEILSNRFQAWRKLLKDLITYFREIQTSYESRSKALLKVSNVINNTHAPTLFLAQGGLNDAISTLRGFHKMSLTESNKAKDIEDDVITQLNGLRNDLNQKIKEIKSLSDDFKNSVEKKKEGTRKAVNALQDALSEAEGDPASSGVKHDPYIIRLSVDRQVELQIEEENYLHRAYLNLEGSGRELESIVVGEIQKAYNAYVGILRRESDHAHETIDDLRAGPIAMPKDHEWTHFVEHDDHFVNPNIPLRKLEEINYPGKHNPSAMEIKSGMLERKSKYLKSYTPGWYVLSPTHLHEFKSGDHLHTQTPVMSLYLLDQKLGSHSQPDATSHKFSFKGRQTGAMHRGHSWVFRAESYDTMVAWYEAIKILTEKTTAERNAFIRRHARSVSGGTGSYKPSSISSDGIEEDEADVEPYSGNLIHDESGMAAVKRPEPGGRFPSDVDVNRGLQAPHSPSSTGSSENKNGLITKPVNSTRVQPITRSEQNDAIDRKDHYTSVEAGIVAIPVQNVDGETSKTTVAEGGPTAQPGMQNSAAQNDNALPDSGRYELAASTAMLPKLPSNEHASTVDGHMEESRDNVFPFSSNSAVTAGIMQAPKVDSEVEAPGLKIPVQPELPDEYRITSSGGLATQVVTSSHPNGLGLSPGVLTKQSSGMSSSQESTVPEPKGRVLPAVLRHDTSISASELHMPGEFPQTPADEK